MSEDDVPLDLATTSFDWRGCSLCAGTTVPGRLSRRPGRTEETRRARSRHRYRTEPQKEGIRSGTRRVRVDTPKFERSELNQG